ncbi:MAG: DUF58 domain-containing protein, partial [Verrucomicrobiales bacterium]|nr:DUF58 domain-containing protein [Verrucomicrobiales bacterium]
MERPKPESKPVITSVGTAVLWMGVTLCLSGGVLFSGVTILLGLACLAALLAARFLCERNLQNLSLQRRMPASAFAGESFEASIQIRRAGARVFDGFDLQIRDKLLQTVASFARVDQLDGQTGGEITLQARIPRRGRHRRAKYEVKSSWPFGLFERKISGRYEPQAGAPGSGDIVIYPRPFLPALILQQLHQFHAESLARDTFDLENAGDFRGIRPYRPGDRVKAIHWPATARAAELLVRDWDPPQPKPQRFGIILHSFTRPGQLVQPDRFETALRIVAGLLLYCRNQKIPVWLCPDVHAQTWLKIPDETGFTPGLEALALAEPRGLKHPRKLQQKLKEFEPCERLFVISDSPIETWQKHVIGRHPHPVFADPETVSTLHSR